MSVDVSVIVVTYNARDLIDQCLQALRDQRCEGVSREVIVVDNDSADDTVARVRASWPDVRVIETGRNGGMAAGNNVGMCAARGRALLLLNSDAFLEADALRIMLERLDAEPAGSTACVAPRLVNLDGSPQASVRGFPTAWRYATEFLFLRRMLPRMRITNAFYGAGIRLDEPGTVDWVTGACLLVPRSSVDAVGLMDEAFFMYGEEVEWLHRMARRGLRVAWEPRAVVRHVGGGSSGARWGELYQQQLVNHVRYMAIAHGVGAARRTRRVLRAALLLRAAMWWCAGRSLRVRARASLEGARRLAAFDPRRPGSPVIPTWPALQREPADLR